MLALVEDYVLKLNHALGYDFNTVEFGVQNGIPYAIDFCNPAPDADISSVGKANFDWIVENAANFAIERALAHQDGQMNLTWGTFVKNATQGLAANALSTSSTTTVTTTKVEPKVTTVVTKAEPKTTVKVEKAAAPKKVVSTKDDLKIVEGIGPKIEELLNAAGINTWAQLSETKADVLKTILAGGGKRYAIHDPSTWAQQAGLAAVGKIDELKTWQAELTGGKK
jgi:predicted flap endonuclease-1-like 5' DNA nuclease